MQLKKTRKLDSDESPFARPLCENRPNAKRQTIEEKEDQHQKVHPEPLLQ